MLLQFSVNNFKSFKDMAVLSMEPSADKELPGNLTLIGKNRCLNTIAIFGANAAGKSNVFTALTAAILLVRRSNSRQVIDPLVEIIPFKFDEESIACDKKDAGSHEPASFFACKPVRFHLHRIPQYMAFSVWWDAAFTPPPQSQHPV